MRRVVWLTASSVLWSLPVAIPPCAWPLPSTSDNSPPSKRLSPAPPSASYSPLPASQLSHHMTFSTPQSHHYSSPPTVSASCSPPAVHLPSAPTRPLCACTAITTRTFCARIAQTLSRSATSCSFITSATCSFIAVDRFTVLCLASCSAMSRRLLAAASLRVLIVTVALTVINSSHSLFSTRTSSSTTNSTNLPLQCSNCLSACSSHSSLHTTFSASPVTIHSPHHTPPPYHSTANTLHFLSPFSSLSAA